MSIHGLLPMSLQSTAGCCDFKGIAGIAEAYNSLAGEILSSRKLDALRFATEVKHFSH
jgi:hypothetical protein